MTCWAIQRAARGRFVSLLRGCTRPCCDLSGLLVTIQGSRRGARSPFPVPNLRHVLAVLADIALVIDQLVAKELTEVRGAGAESRDAIDDVLDQMEAIDIVEH